MQKLLNLWILKQVPVHVLQTHPEVDVVAGSSGRAVKDREAPQDGVPTEEVTTSSPKAGPAQTPLKIKGDVRQTNRSTHEYLTRLLHFLGGPRQGQPPPQGLQKQSQRAHSEPSWGVQTTMSYSGSFSFLWQCKNGLLSPPLLLRSHGQNFFFTTDQLQMTTCNWTPFYTPIWNGHFPRNTSSQIIQDGRPNFFSDCNYSTPHNQTMHIYSAMAMSGHWGSIVGRIAQYRESWNKSVNKLFGTFLKFIQPERELIFQNYIYHPFFLLSMIKVISRNPCEQIFNILSIIQTKSKYTFCLKKVLWNK